MSRRIEELLALNARSNKKGGSRVKKSSQVNKSSSKPSSKGFGLLSLAACVGVGVIIGSQGSGSTGSNGESDAEADRLMDEINDMIDEINVSLETISKELE